LNYKYLYIILLFPAIVFGHKNKPKTGFGKTNSNFYKHEFDVGIGVLNYLGELGGSDGAPKNFSVGDAEISQFKFAFTGAWRYNLAPKFSIRTSYTVGQVSGNDELTNEVTRNYRNLAFRTNINELMVLGEFFITRADYGHSFHRTGVTGRTGTSLSLSLHTGIGFLKFNPTYNGVDLQPLNTEGQGLDGAESPYKLNTLILPIGFNIGYEITKWMRIGLDVTQRFTRTDYLDDVSGNYYDKELIRTAYGDLAAEMSDRTDGSRPWTEPGAPRGNPDNKDSYFSLMVVATYTPFIRSYKATKRRYKAKF